MDERWDWEHAAREQRTAIAATSPQERLRWLEEVQELALAAGALAAEPEEGGPTS